MFCGASMNVLFVAGSGRAALQRRNDSGPAARILEADYSPQCHAFQLVAQTPADLYVCTGAR